MRLGIEIIWAIGLAGILIPTVIVLKQVALIHRELSNIYRLSEIILQAAKGIRSNLVPLSGLPTLAGPAAATREATASIASTSGSLVARLPFKI